MYRDLMAQLEIDNIRDLEDLLISDCFHTGLISGKLDQKEQCLYVTNAASRDVKPEDVQGIVDKLFQWWISKHFHLLYSLLIFNNHNNSFFIQGKPPAKFAQKEIVQSVILLRQADYIKSSSSKYTSDRYM